MAEDKEKLPNLIKKRSIMKGKVSKFGNYLKSVKSSELGQVQIAELECRLSKIDSLYSDFDALQTEIEMLGKTPEPQFEDREQFETQYFELVALARTLLNSSNNLVRRASVASLSGSESEKGTQDFVRLPKIDLPHFHGDYQLWLEFRDTYLSLIHNNSNITNINKFHYLRAALKGSAALIIQSLDFCSDNYSIAWQLLSDRYDNQRMLVNNHIQALFSIEQIQKESAQSLRNLIDVMSKNLRCLASLGQPTDHWDTLIIFIISRKLDYSTSRQWEEFKNSLAGCPTLQQFVKFLNNRADLLQTLNHNKHTLNTHKDIHKPKTFTATTNDSFKTIVCPLCKQNHYLYGCQTFRDLDVDSRIKKVSKFSVCRNCLRPGHSENRCKLSHCKYCSHRHNTLLHKETHIETENPVALSTDITQSSKGPLVLLSTALVKVSDHRGGLHTARLLLDNGSTSHFVTLDLCEKLGLVRRSTSSTVKGINNQFSYSAESCNLTIESNVGDYKATINCYVLPEITKSLPSSYIDITNIPLPPGIQLADPSFHKPASIDLLLGAEIFWEVLGTKFIHLGQQLPKLHESKLGWLITGSIPKSATSSKNKNIPTCCFSQNLEDQLTRFWELDSISPKHCLSTEERACEQHFLQHTTRNEDGRFVVSIPLKESPNTLGESYAQAKCRLLSLERRFSRDTNFKQQYLEFMHEYISLGHMTKNTDKGCNPSYYMPHHGVVNQSSTTTKMRVVFDASAVTSSGKSFNDIQMVGPVVQNDLLSILIRFRQHRYVVTSDVEKMYRAILIQSEQRSLQQILFRFDSKEPISVYTLNRLTYGTASAPYLATKCLTSLADQSTKPEVKIAIENDFYVDDYLGGGDTVEFVIDLCKNVKEILKSVHFNLRKWQSNEKEILKSITEGESLENHEIKLNLNDTSPCKTLGLLWNSHSDHLLFSIDLQTTYKKITKRIILSLISQVFDPMGLISPCILEVKIMIQQLWIQKLSWDDEVPSDIKNDFINFLKALPALNSLRIPRWVSSHSDSVLEIHTFTDASERAYGACVYIKSITKEGKVSVHLLVSKTKVAPVKPTTIPRLELSAGLLGARLCNKVLQSLRVELTRCVFWTDSTIVLGWLSTANNQLRHFVRNRVNEIQDITAGGKWSYIPTKENPADLASRGVKADCISSSALWWSGPQLLHEKDLIFPKIPNSKTESLPETLLHTTTQDTYSQNNNTNNKILQIIHNTSNFTRLIRKIAFLKRFIYNYLHPNAKNYNHLSTNELKDARNTILRLCQQEMFPDEYRTLLSKKPLNKNNKLVALSPFVDCDNIIRVGGRLDHSFYSYDIKHPIVLCSKHHITKLIFHMYHINLLHAGPQLMLANLRHCYWPIGGTNLAKYTVKKCVKCSRHKSQTTQPTMGQLPAQRVHLEFPFQNCGLDYGGPIMLVDRKGRGAKLTKSYICVFVCFAVKAIHLELVTDLTKETFLAALQRFIARRGLPETIHADNGTTFVGAHNQIERMLKASSHEITQKGINFKFIPPYAPHFGGLWESAVKSVKHLLRRTLSLTHLTYEEMSTCLIHIESILNSRPLTPISSDPCDLTCLTPSHFLIGRTPSTIPCPQVTDDNISRLQRFDRIQALKDHFWQRFTNEYISRLQQKVKWHSSKGEELKVGSLVLIKDKAAPPLLWLMGRITKLHSGIDSSKRVAEIYTKKGTILRAYNNICPLPVY